MAGPPIKPVIAPRTSPATATLNALAHVASSAILTGCADASDPGALWEVHDSVGVRIVESHGPVLGDPLPWTVEPEPALSLGELDGPAALTFQRIGSAFVLPDGRLVVVDTGARELRLFDLDGTHLATLGGPGQGPGEFRALDWVAPDPVHQERLLAMDPGAAAVLRLFLEGREVDRIALEGFRADRLPPELDRRGRLGAAHTPVGVFSDGSFVSEVFEGWQPDDMGSGPLWPLEPVYLHVGGDGAVRSVAGRFLRQHMVVDPRVGQPLALPFGPRGRLVPHRDRVVFGDGAEFEVRVHQPGGPLEEIWRRRWAPRPVTDRERREFRERSLRAAGYVEGEPDSERVTWRRTLLDHTPWPAHHPAFDRVVSGALGHLWVREWDDPGPEGDPRWWSIFDPEGRWLGRLELPGDLDVREIGAHHVLGVHTGEMGVQRIRLHRLRRGEG